MRRRFGITAALAGALILSFLGGCADSGTYIVGDVSFLNNPGREFPPANHPNYGSADLSDEVCYVRLVDDDGAGSVIWESEAYPVTFLDDYIYDPDDINNQTPTPDEGVFIESFVISLTDAQLSGAIQPLRLEAYLYDDEVTSPIDPATDTQQYSYTAENPDTFWYRTFTVTESSTVRASLYITVPFS